jgi:hypothetical protein
MRSLGANYLTRQVILVTIMLPLNLEMALNLTLLARLTLNVVAVDMAAF